jgi:hypothetical protein
MKKFIVFILFFLINNAHAKSIFEEYKLGSEFIDIGFGLVTEKLIDNESFKVSLELDKTIISKVSIDYSIKGTSEYKEKFSNEIIKKYKDKLIENNFKIEKETYFPYELDANNGNEYVYLKIQEENLKVVKSLKKIEHEKEIKKSEISIIDIIY